MYNKLSAEEVVSEFEGWARKRMFWYLKRLNGESTLKDNMVFRAKQTMLEDCLDKIVELRYL